VEEAAESTNIKKFIVVGGSHAARLAVALEDEGHCVETITQPGLTLTGESVENLVHMIEDKVRSADPDTCIVYFLYDNDIYLAEGENGEKSLPTKPRGSRVYHVEGKLVTASREEFKEIFNVSVPLLRGGGDLNKIILSPLARYVQAPCCDNEDHCTNFQLPSYRQQMGEKMANMETWIRDFTFSKRIRNFRVVSATCAVSMTEEGKLYKNRILKEMWGTDAVHLSPSGYAKLGEVICLKSDQEFTRAKRRLPTSGSQQKVSNLSNKRAKWVTEDEVTASRNLGQKDKTSNWRTNQWRGWRPGGRGRGGHRGGRGGRPGRARGPRY
jgi:hypothetical protein